VNVEEWLMSFSNSNLHQNSYLGVEKDLNYPTKAYKISFISGKGGVGKTSISIKVAKTLAEQGFRVLLIDCDYNLSNTRVKLNIPMSYGLHGLFTTQKKIEDCLYRDGNFHLLSGSNGSIDIFDNKVDYDQIIMDIISEVEHRYDFILLDCPAGLEKKALNLSVYCDDRIIIVTPDKSSLADSYSLMKILNIKYAIRDNSIVVNMSNSLQHYKKVVKILAETTDRFLDCRINFLGEIQNQRTKTELFSEVFLNDDKSAVHKNFIKVIDKITERARRKASEYSSAAFVNYVKFVDDQDKTGCKK
jgi:flagellar biosynthesis protein FlhG